MNRKNQHLSEAPSFRKGLKRREVARPEGFEPPTTWFEANCAKSGKLLIAIAFRIFKIPIRSPYKQRETLLYRATETCNRKVFSLKNIYAQVPL